MGWNSWDSFATTLTEDQAIDNAKVMAKVLLPHGYDVFTVDIQWYEPGATGFDYRKDAHLELDPWGRLLPAVNRFPASANGAGFKPLGDRLHALGLKFGIHLMRGVPRQAADRNLPVLGTDVRSATSSTGPASAPGTRTCTAWT
jgi:alpha-galactosidase